MAKYRTYKTEAGARRYRDKLRAESQHKLAFKDNIYCVIPAPDQSFRYCVALMWPNNSPLAGQVRAYCS